MCDHGVYEEGYFSGKDEDFDFVDDDEIEDLDDFEYEEEWDDEQ